MNEKEIVLKSLQKASSNGYIRIDARIFDIDKDKMIPDEEFVDEMFFDKNYISISIRTVILETNFVKAFFGANLVDCKTDDNYCIFDADGKKLITEYWKFNIKRMIIMESYIEQLKYLESFL